MAYDMLTILGPTASGKTTLAAHLARQLAEGTITQDMLDKEPPSMLKQAEKDDETDLFS